MQLSSRLPSRHLYGGVQLIYGKAHRCDTQPVTLTCILIYRVGVPPFTCARKVLETLGSEESFEWKKKRESTPDLIQLCHDVPLEVVQLKVGK